MPTGKPTITDEHISKYNAIMGTAVKSNAVAAPASPPAEKEPSGMSINALLASLPKAKGIGNKMFVFTGKKKIIMDGTQREVENIKTVDAMPEKDLPAGRQGKKEEKPEKILSEKELVAKDVPTEVVETKHEEKKETHAPQKTHSPITQTEKKTAKMKLPIPLLVGALVLFFVAWTFFWLVLFGYIKF